MSCALITKRETASNKLAIQWLPLMCCLVSCGGMSPEILGISAAVKEALNKCG